MEENTTQTQERSSEFRVDSPDKLLWLAKKIFVHESKALSLQSEMNAMISNYKLMISKEEADVQELKLMFGADVKEYVKENAVNGEKSLMTPYGRIGYRAKPGSISGDTVPAVEFWESDFPHIVETVEKKKVAISNLTAEEREQIYRLKVEGKLPSYIKVSIPDPESMYLDTSIKDVPEENS